MEEDLNAIISSFNAEINEKDKRISTLKDMNERLLSQIEMLNNQYIECIRMLSKLSA